MCARGREKKESLERAQCLLVECLATSHNNMQPRRKGRKWKTSTLQTLFLSFVLVPFLLVSFSIHTITLKNDDDLMALSYSLFGTKAKNWWEAMVATAQQVPAFYPGWQVRIYHDTNVPTEILTKLSDMKHIKLIDVATELPAVHHSFNPKTWRFLIASDPTVAVYAIRDVDSRPTRRERAAVNEWLAIRNSKNFHMMRDHPGHDPRNFAAILGGMWGGTRKAVPQMEQLLRDYYNDTSQETTTEFDYADDQDFLWKYILPLARNDCVQHDSYYCIESGGIAFPRDRDAPYEYVGNVFNRYAHFNGLIKDPRLDEPEAVQRFQKCLELRRDTKSSDTSYKGRSDASSTQLMAEAKGAAQKKKANEKKKATK